MDALIDFIFRKKHYEAEMFVEDSEFPCLVFVFPLNEELKNEFGEEITVKTDFERLLPKMDDYPAIVDLRKAVFAVIQNTEMFLTAKRKWQALNHA